MLLHPTRKNPLPGVRRKKATDHSCHACLFSPANCQKCVYQQSLIDLLEHSLQIIKALPNTCKKK
jgi:hypothetical protein